MILSRSSFIVHLRNLSFPVHRLCISPYKRLCYPLHSSISVCCRNLSGTSGSDFLKRGSRRFGRFRAFGVVPAHSEVEKDGTETFFAEEGVSWESLGVSDEISGAVANAGLHRPSLVQAACIPRMLSGNDVVVAAETGSGKTHSYLVPIIDKLRSGSSGSESSDDSKGQAHSSWYCLILCPNGTLCEQVARMANSVCNDNGEALVTVAALGGQQGNWNVKKPDIIVSTPVAFQNMVEGSHQNPRRSSFIRRAKYVVLDEADLLLCGSFKKEVINLINMFRYDEKRRTWTTEEKSDSMNQEVGDESSSEREATVSARNLKRMHKTRMTKRISSWKMLRAHERSKQYIFAAATLPVNGKETAGAIVRQMFPNVSWISGNFLHCHSPRLKEEWVEVTAETHLDALINAVNHGFQSEKHTRIASRTMIFTNTVTSAEAVATKLERANIKCLQYHSNNSLYERSQSLMEFHKRGGVLVCTDSAARGVDIPNISHVIQAEFARSAIDFLHRTGRTARAGQFGLVTSLYTESDKDLVAAVRQAAERGIPLASAFSRNRSFRNKLKKARRAMREAEIGDGTPCASSQI